MNAEKSMFHWTPKKSSIVVIDSCAIDYIHNKRALQSFFCSDSFTIYSCPSLDKELNHMNTPLKTREPLNSLEFFDIPIKWAIDHPPGGYSQLDIDILEGIKLILKGNAIDEKHKPDAEHVFSTARNSGYFVTVDPRVLQKRDEISYFLGNKNYSMHKKHLGGYRFIFSPEEFMSIANGKK